MSWQILQGDVRQVLETLPDASVQCCVTSPPYWGLRDYGTATWEGGDAACDHRSPTMREGRNENRATLGGGVMATNSAQLLLAARTNCGKCGARRIDNQIGLEATPDAYVAQMVQVFAQVKRVLTDDGTLWLNLGDSYWGGKGENGSSKARATAADRGYSQSGGTVQMSKRPQDGTHSIIKAKDLCGIPWRVAFALQADGWYLRSDIIWSKPNPMPESVTDRPTKAHEYLFLLAKSERYFYDAAAIAEQSLRAGDVPGGGRAERNAIDPLVSLYRPENAALPVAETRNRRTVWTVATQPYADAHFAVMPRALVEPCVLAGSRTGDVVLDPFLGSGTVAQVAQDLGRRWIGCELNPDYVQMQRTRTAQTALVLEAAD